MTQVQKSAAWDALMGLMEDDTGSVVLANLGYGRLRRMWWSQGEWHTNAATPEHRNPSFTIELYRGDDPLAALAALVSDENTHS